jgi:hypothetical protein
MNLEKLITGLLSIDMDFCIFADIGKILARYWQDIWSDSNPFGLIVLF